MSRLQPLTWNAPIVDPQTGVPTLEFQRAWAQQIASNATVPGSLNPGSLLANAGSSVAVAADTTLTALLDKVLTTTQGAIIYRSATGWTFLPPGATDQVLTTGGPGANPSWGAAAPSVPALTHNHVFVGDASNEAGDVALSGDATIADTGALTLANSGVTAATYGDSTHYPTFTVDVKGRLTAASTQSVPAGANPTATASDTAVNGSAATFIRSDGAPAVQKADTSHYGLVKPDGVTTSIVGGLLVANGSVSNTTYQHMGSNSTSAAHSFASQGNIYVPFQNMSVLSVSMLLTTVTSGVYKIGIAPWDGVSKITGSPTYSNSVTAGTGAANSVVLFSFSSPVSLTKGSSYIIFIVRTDATASTSMTLNFGNTISSQSPALFSSPSAVNQFFEVASLAPTTSDTWSTPGSGVCTQIIVYTIP